MAVIVLMRTCQAMQTVTRCIAWLYAERTSAEMNATESIAHFGMPSSTGISKCGYLARFSMRRHVNARAVIVDVSSRLARRSLRRESTKRALRSSAVQQLGRQR